LRQFRQAFEMSCRVACRAPESREPSNGPGEIGLSLHALEGIGGFFRPPPGERAQSFGERQRAHLRRNGARRLGATQLRHLTERLAQWAKRLVRSEPHVGCFGAASQVPCDAPKRWSQVTGVAL